MNALTSFVLRHKRLVLGTWLVIAVTAVLAMQPANDALSPEFSMPGQEGYETNQELRELYGSGGDIAPLVPVVELPQGTSVDSPEVRADLEDAMRKVEAAVPGSNAVSYASTGDDAFVSTDGRTTFALVYIEQKGGVNPGWTEAEDAREALEGVTVVGAPVQLTGLDALRASAGESEADGTGVLVGTLIAALGALVVLLFVFRSFMAIVPLLMAMVAVPTTFLMLWPVAEITDVSVIVQFLVALIGLGIAIDYSLLAVVRWREERMGGGVSNEEAVRRSMAHAGSAVVFSGTTVAISLLSLVALPVPFLRSIGVAGLLIALASVAVAVTLLPVLLATIGPRLDYPRSRRDAQASRGWTAWARMIVRRPRLAAAASGAALVLLVGAAFTIELGNPRAQSLANGGSARAALAQLEQSGIGAGPLTPFDSIVDAPDATGVARALGSIEGVRGAAAPAEWRRGDVSRVAIIPEVDGNSAEGRATLERIRDAELGADLRIGGDAASSTDFIDAVYGNFVLVLTLISVLTFLLLARAFRSLLLPLKAVLLNLLSVGAAWGLIVLVFQHGYGSDAIWGITATHAINVEMPMVVFAFLFGISMDYQVFILSRMREAYDRTGSTEAAVVEGVGRTGRLVSSAALILGFAFAAFSFSPGTEAKIFALALGGGILIDATIIRGVLAPSVVALMGRWNWWMPRPVARLLGVEASPVQPEAVATSVRQAA